ncbi:MAG TPA: class E sortase [Ilumatobacter sp.]
MNPTRPPVAVTRAAPARVLVMVGALAVAVSACGGSEPEVVAATTVVVATTTAPPTTTLPPVTTTTVAATTTLATTTTTSTLPVQQTEPIAPPADWNAKEPVIDLGAIRIPAIDVDSRLYEGIRMPTLDYGPGHWPGSAMPGEIGNMVVAGHRTSKHRVFRNVDQLVEGDEIIVEADGREYVYLVREVVIVEPTALWIVDPTPTGTITLFACHPPGSTAQRIVVFADLVI